MCRCRLAGGLLLRELLRTLPDVFRDHAGSILPVAFGAKMDDDKGVAAAWAEVGWQQLFHVTQLCVWGALT